MQPLGLGMHAGKGFDDDDLIARGGEGACNYGNLVVGQDATARMIDCDSFQVSQSGKTWLCEVGVGMRLLALSGAATVMASVRGAGQGPSSPGGGAPTLASARPTLTPAPLPSAPPGSSTPLVSVPANQGARSTMSVGVHPTPEALRPSTSAMAEAVGKPSTPPASPISQVPASTMAASTAAGVERVVMKQAGYVRAAASGNAVVVRTAPNGSRLRVFDRSSGWVQVAEKEPSGWVYSGLVEPAS